MRAGRLRRRKKSDIIGVMTAGMRPSGQEGKGMAGAGVLGLTLPAMAAMLYFYFTIRDRFPHLMAKGGATWMALTTAVFCYSQGSDLPVGGLMIAATALFVLADVLLDVRFLAGVAAFGLGHAALIGWIIAQKAHLSQPLLSGFSVLMAAVLYALAVFIFRRKLRQAGKKAIVMLVYAVVLSLMTAMAASLLLSGGLRYLVFALGAVCFMISDLLVAQGMLAGMARKWHVLAMILYESAVMMMAVSV